MLVLVTRNRERYALSIYLLIISQVVRNTVVAAARIGDVVSEAKRNNMAVSLRGKQMVLFPKT